MGILIDGMIKDVEKEETVIEETEVAETIKTSVKTRIISLTIPTSKRTEVNQITTSKMMKVNAGMASNGCNVLAILSTLWLIMSIARWKR